MAVETEIVPSAVEADINVRVAMAKVIVTRSEFTAGFDGPLGFRMNLKGTLLGLRIEMADSTVGWTFNHGMACRRQRPGRSERGARSHAAAARPAKT